MSANRAEPVMFSAFSVLPDYRLDILSRETGKLISTGYFTVKQEEQIGEIVRGLNPNLMTFKLYSILHEFEEKSEFGAWLAENTQMPMDPGI